MKFIILTIASILSTSVFSQARNVNYDESLVPNYTLPESLEFECGRQIKGISDWEDRRIEIISHFENEIYGVAPVWDGEIKSIIISKKNDAIDGLAERYEILLRLNREKKVAEVQLLLYLPKNMNKTPVFLGYNFHGNHTTVHDDDIQITKKWVRNNDISRAKNNTANYKGRGTFSGRWPIKEVISRGYGVATLYYGDIDLDYDDGFRNGVHDLYDLERDSTSWASISAWSWGLSRVMDYFETNNRIDVNRIFTLGHSRLGKTALWAAAIDERFAMAISNNSGCGGAALSRRNFGESVEKINAAFPHWFNNNFKKYNNNENSLPVDQHQLIALLAPRSVYIASASEDLWADPKGEFLSGVHASSVYKLYDKDGLQSETFPSINSPLHKRSIGYHIREGKHDITLYDWIEFMNYIDIYSPAN